MHYIGRTKYTSMIKLCIVFTDTMDRADPVYSRYLLGQAKAMSRLCHPNVITMAGLCTEGRSYVLFNQSVTWCERKHK